jgi:hypothetical protein
LVKEAMAAPRNPPRSPRASIEVGTLLVLYIHPSAEDKWWEKQQQGGITKLD